MFRIFIYIKDIEKIDREASYGKVCIMNDINYILLRYSIPIDSNSIDYHLKKVIKHVFKRYPELDLNDLRTVILSDHVKDKTPLYFAKHESGTSTGNYTLPSVYIPVEKFTLRSNLTLGEFSSVNNLLYCICDSHFDKNTGTINF